MTAKTIHNICAGCGEIVELTEIWRNFHAGQAYHGHRRCIEAPLTKSPMTLANIALTGKLRSGKDSVAAYLTEKYGYTRFAFGDELKRYYHELFGATKTKPREGYQWFGTAMRQRESDVWVRKCFDKIARESAVKTLHNDGTYWPRNVRPVITDMRQPNEFAECKRLGYVIIRVNASEGVRINRAVESADTFNYADLRHETESHVDGFAADYDVYNDGDMAGLYAQIEAIMTEVVACRANAQS